MGKITDINKNLLKKVTPVVLVMMINLIILSCLLVVGKVHSTMYDSNGIIQKTQGVNNVNNK